MTPQGEVVVVLPQRMASATAATLVERHAVWLQRHLATAAARQAHLDARPPLGAGRVIGVNGIPHRVLLICDAAASRGSVQRVLDADLDGIVGVLEVRYPPEREPVPMLEQWLRAEARRVLRDRVDALAPLVGVRPSSLSVRDQQTRWGSASRDGSLSFSWRLILAPAFVLDAVVIHELCHLRHADHGAAFWRLARHHAPRTDEARRWLRTNRVELRSALD